MHNGLKRFQKLSEWLKYRKCKFKENCEFRHEGVNNETNDDYETLKANLKDLEMINEKLADENTRMKNVLEVKNTKSVNAEKEIDGLKAINDNLIEAL